MLTQSCRISRYSVVSNITRRLTSSWLVVLSAIMMMGVRMFGVRERPADTETFTAAHYTYCRAATQPIENRLT